MKRLFLTSSVHAVAHDIVKRVDLSRGNRLVFITTAAEPKQGDLTWLKNDRQALVDAGFDLIDYTITNKLQDQLKKELSPFDYIYLSGGDTPYLLKQSQKTGFINIVRELINKEGKVYIGTSAGSIIAGPKLPEYLFEDDGEAPDKVKNEGYGFINFTVVPHWGSEDFRDRYLNKRLKIAYKKDQVPLLLLTDSQYVSVENDKFEIVNVVASAYVYV